MTPPTSPLGACRIGVSLGGAEISVEAFLTAVLSLTKLLSELDRSLSGAPRLDWQLAALREGSAEVALRPAARTGFSEDYAETVVFAALDGFDALDRKGTPPVPFSGGALRSVATLTRCGADPISVFAEGQERKTRRVEITPRIRENAKTLSETSSTTMGSVEGTLEALTIHGHNAFVVYRSLDNRRVECLCDGATLKKAVELLGRRVIATGEIRREGDLPASVRVTELSALGDGTPARPEDLRGLLRDDPIDINEWSRHVREKW